MPPSRFEPCMPPENSPAANRPGTWPRGVGIDLDPAHHVVAGRADLHRLLGDVDVGQLLELVVHRRQLAHDLLGGRREAMSRKTPPCGEPRPGLDLGVDRAGDLVAREQFRRAPVVVRVVVPAVGLLLGVRVSARNTSGM